jgi:periplasmic protein TonB
LSAQGRRWRVAARWSACFALALCFHIAGAVVLLARWNEDDARIVNAPVITVELAPRAEAPATKPSELPPGPEQTASPPQAKAQRAKTERVQPKPPSAKTIELSVLPPRRPVIEPREKARRHDEARLASAPSSVRQKSRHAAAPAPGAASHNPLALPNWKSELMARLERYKRYPPEAQARGEQGVAQLAFKVDRNGRVHDPHIVRSSGSHLLDRATLALIERAQPLPAPPPQIRGTEIAIVVPIRYNMP